MPDERRPCWKCRFSGSLADQVFICLDCGAYPEECMDGECGCYAHLYDSPDHA